MLKEKLIPDKVSRVLDIYYNIIATYNLIFVAYNIYNIYYNIYVYKPISSNRIYFNKIRKLLNKKVPILYENFSKSKNKQKNIQQKFNYSIFSL